MAGEGADAFLIADPDSVFYFSGVWGYLGMEFGRATLLLVPRDGEPSLITPAMEAEMARALSGLRDLREWTDGLDGEWMKHVSDLLGGKRARTIMLEPVKTHPSVSAVLRETLRDAKLRDGTALISAMRVIKSEAEIAIMRQAGQVAVAMVAGGKAAISEGVPEYELALAIITAGTRKAAEFLTAPDDQLVSPTIYNLQIMQSGHHTCMVHRRSTVKRLVKGDPVYFCFCGIANFKQFKLGFDREFFVGSATDEQARTYETAVRAQQAALAMVRPGAIAADVHAAAEEVYRSAGFGLSYRTGRAVGYSFLEEPQLKRGDQTRLEPGMTFAVDGGITVPGKFGARVGDSIVVTKNGFDYLTEYPRGLAIV
jgi:Xaa-Pro aminopeptidase